MIGQMKNNGQIGRKTDRTNGKQTDISKIGEKSGMVFNVLLVSSVANQYSQYAFYDAEKI